MPSAIQAAISYGLAAGASILGQRYLQYRPQSAADPTGGASFMGTLPALFTADATGKTVVPAPLGKNAWWGLFDTSRTLAGDYLVGSACAFPGDTDTWFVTSQFSLQGLPGVIKCSNIFSVLRPAGNASIGVQPYGGDIPGDETPILTGWPGGLLQGTKGEKGDSVLPGDVRMPWYYVFIPAVVIGGAVVKIEAADVLTDDFGRRFKVSSCELTNAGWRLTAILAQT